MLMLGKTNLKSISNNLAKMAINWHKIGQMPLWHKNINLGITWSFFSKCFIFKGGGGGGVHPDYFVKLDFEIAVDQQTKAKGQ